MSITGNFIRRILISLIILLLIASSNIIAQGMDSTNTPNKSSGGMYGDDQKSMIEKRASDLTSDLQSKVNLTDSQVSAVKSDLIDYFTKVSAIQSSQRAGLKEKSPSDSSMSMSSNTSDDLKNADTDASSKIESVITDDQKSKWSDVKDSWWSEVKSVAYNNSMNK